MQQFVQTGLFSLIRETSKRSIPASEWGKSYEAFAEKIFTVSVEQERVKYQNALCYAKAELVFWRAGLKKMAVYCRTLKKPSILLIHKMIFYNDACALMKRRRNVRF